LSHLWPTGSSWVSPSITARYFSSCPSDSILRYSLDGHPALRSTASSGSSSALAVSSFRLRARLDFCLPSAFSGQRGITPACWIWRPSFERQRDLNPPEQRAAQHALCRCPTPRGRACGPYGLSLLPPSYRRNPAAGVSEVSRFSCMKFLGVSGVFDYAGPNRDSRYRPCPFCLPCITKTSASGLHLFGAQWPTPPVPLFTLRCAPHGTQRKTRGRVDRYSFLVGFLPPLLHTGCRVRQWRGPGFE
jgi:hypothetical protein